MSTVRLAVVVLAASLAGVSGCASGRSSVTLTCQSGFPNARLAADIALIAGDDKAISGQWASAEADAAGDEEAMTHPTAAQTKAADDLISVEHDLSAAAKSSGPIASAAGVLYLKITALTGNNPTAAEGAAVHAGIVGLEQACGAAS